jgi:hypothetical protein
MWEPPRDGNIFGGFEAGNESIDGCDISFFFFFFISFSLCFFDKV